MSQPEMEGTDGARASDPDAAQSAGMSAAQSAGTSAFQSAGTSAAQSAGTSAAQSAGTSAAQSAGMSTAQSEGMSVVTSTGTEDIASQAEQLRLEQPQLQWFFLKDLKKNGQFYPSAQHLFVKNMKVHHESNRTIAAINFIRIVANLCMIETGLVPLTVERTPICSVRELLSLTIAERMIKLTDTLSSYFEKRTKLDEVYYTYIKAKDNQIEQKLSPETSRIDDSPFVQEIDNFEYSTDIYKLMIWHSGGDELFVTLKGRDCDLSLEIDRMLVWKKDIRNQDAYHLSYLILYFLKDNFLSQMKRGISYAFIDQFSALSTEYQGFEQLPDELVQNFARYLDGRTLVKFSQTCNRMNRILDTDENWKLQCERIPKDFAQYRYEPPSEETIRQRLTEEGQFKEKYKGMYGQAKSDYREQLRRRRRWLHSYEHRFGHLIHGFRRY